MGYYIGETIEWTSNLSTGVIKLSRATSIKETGLAVFKIGSNAKKGVETTIDVVHSIFAEKAKETFGTNNVEEIKTTVSMEETENGINVEVISKATSFDGDFIEQIESFEIKGTNLLEEINQ